MENLAQRTTILVVDDEPLIRCAAADCLRDAGYLILEADDGEEAMAFLNENPEIGVLFTDINMPGMDGFALAIQVRARWPLMGVVLTSGLERPTAAQIPARGYFIGKPYADQQLTDLMAKAAA
jgi:CheY-like chemotaxis protein